jgi:GntR family transcriptional regulator
METPMVGVLDRTGGQKLYIQLAELIREQIKAGQIKEGDLLPTEDNFCRSYEVSKAVVRQAMTELAREGWVLKRQGIGTFASRPQFREGPVMVTGLSDRILDFGLAFETHVIHKGPAALPSDLTALFGGEPPDIMFKIVRLRRVKGSPVLLETAYIHAALCPGLALDDLKNQSLFELIEKRYNLRIQKVACSVDMTSLGEREADLLKAPVGKPALLFDQILTLAGDRTLGFIRSLCPSGDHRIAFEWTRQG